MSQQQKRVWCYQCEAVVETTGESSGPKCVNCNSDFLEELAANADAPEDYRRDDVPAQEINAVQNGDPPGSSLLHVLAAVLQLRRNHESQAHSDQLNGLLQAILLSAGQGSLNLGDFANDDGMDDIMLRLFAEGGGDQGPPPVTDEVLATIPVEPMAAGHAGEPCPVCKEPIEEGASIRKLPCEHFFCATCITPWLELHATCPVCRHHLGTNDDA